MAKDKMPHPSVKMGGAFGGDLANTTTNKTLKINSIHHLMEELSSAMYMKNDAVKMKQIENPTIKAGKC